jgi:hypothetical protein
VWVTLMMVSALTVLGFLRDAGLFPSVRPDSRQEVPMRNKTRIRLLFVAVLETFSAIGASYTAGSLPT